MPDGSCSASPDSILIVAEHRRGHGTGHLRRCAGLARDIPCALDWLLPAHAGEDWYSREEVWSLLGPGAVPERVCWRDTPAGPYDLIIVDRREMTLRELETLPSRGIVVGIDAGGDLRTYASYLVDALPTPPGSGLPNIADTAFLPFPDESAGRVRPEWPDRCGKVLVAFGGEDQDELTRAAGRELKGETEGPHPLSIELLLHRDGIDGGTGPDTPGVIRPEPRLADRLSRYDLVVTHYGLLAWEALWARVPVLLCNPTDYHQMLAEAAGFVACRSPGELRGALGRFAEIRESSRNLRPRERRNLAEFLRTLQSPPRLESPSGGSRYQPAVERFVDCTYFLNRPDGLLYLQNYLPRPVLYDQDYFNREYLKQYGRTYLEDFPVIAERGRDRVARILRLLRRNASHRADRPRLLDIGCAYGPFLHAASGAGCTVKGLEIHGDAVRYVREELHLEAVQGDLAHLGTLLFQERFDIVTLWYVIEHVVFLDALLRDIAALLKPGGILAFSTPHGRGISARRWRRTFLRDSPPDHFTLWDAPSAKRVLSAQGFRVRRVHCTGHHPERFFAGGAVPSFPGAGLLLRAIGLWSRVFRRGDTFEIYAERL